MEIKRIFIGCIALGLLSCNKENTESTADYKDLSIGIAHCCAKTDTFMWKVNQDIQSELKSKQVGTTYAYVADGDQTQQLSQVVDLMNKDSKALLVSLVTDDTIAKNYQNSLMGTAESNHRPIIFYNRPPKTNLLNQYKNAYFVGSEPAQSGILQAEMIVEQWKKHPEWDKNHDGIIQYVILRGPAGHPDAEARTEWVQATIKSYPMFGIKAQLVDQQFGNWERQKANTITSKWLDNPENNIEVIIANNDDMALGAIEALKAHHEKLPVYGVDALPEALAAIKNGEMNGTVKQDGEAQAKVATAIALNLASGRPADENLNHQMINRRVYIPYVKIDKSNLSQFN